ncbi:MAG: acyl-CoA dehydrogenase family protein [Planctomycetota bacterium]|nr:acyl-CoA dehydrogenase family protein [Planctomycetota bacterium]
MDFRLTEEESAIRTLARDFAQGECLPGAAERDKTETFPDEQIKKAGELGLMGLLVPEQYGGVALSNLALSLALIEINRADASVGVTLSVHNSLTCGSINAWGSDDLKSRYLPQLASGEWLGGYALSESGSGSDAGSLQCKAQRDGDDYVLTGSKAWITSGDRADVLVLFARTDPDAGNKGITAFVVETTSDGLTVGKKEPKLGLRSSSTTLIHLDGVRVPARNILGKENQGFKVALHTLDGGRIGIASQALGIMEACLKASIKYATERKQFDQVIADFQPIQWKLAEMETKIQAGRLLIYRAAELKDRGENHTREAAVAKLFTSRGANWCATQAVQIHGGAGYCTDFPVERYFRDARITEIYEGTTEIQKLVIARSMLRG